VKRCAYCGFYSHGGGVTPEREEAYTKQVCMEIRTRARGYAAGELRRPTVDTVYFGGGTPTIFSAGSIERMLEAARECFDADENAEISIESNPGTLTKDKLRALKSAGINRLSIGCQSFDDEILKKIGRIHTADEFLENYENAREAGFDNINVDLIFSIPGMTMRTWEDTLRKAADLAPEHISTYSLQIEEGTPLYESWEQGDLEETPDDEDRAMYHFAHEFLESAGYRHYEISNFARPGRECRHNLKYWSMEDYIGIGDGASSFEHGVRSTNPPFEERHVNSPFDCASEYVFTGLRKREGFTYSGFREYTGADFEDVFGERRGELLPYLESGALIDTGEGMKLSLYGWDISNGIMSVFV